MKNTTGLFLVGSFALLLGIHDFMQDKIPVQQPASWPAPDSSSLNMPPVKQRKLYYAAVGTINLYGNDTNPGHILLFLSGDGGWDPVAMNIANTLARDPHTLVAGIDLVKYYKKLHEASGKCLYPAGDMEGLSEFIQRKLQLADYQKPVLVGYSAGATLTYALLCQAPAGTFLGGVALGFCPEVETQKPLCKGSGKLAMKPRPDGKGFDFTDQPAPNVPLEVLHGSDDQVCDSGNTDRFFQGVSNVRVTILPRVGHGFAVTKNWVPQFKDAFNRIISSSRLNSALALSSGKQSAQTPPVPAENPGAAPGNTLPIRLTTAISDPSAPLVVFISGDGGWTGFDQQICDQLAQHHWPSVGLNAQSYFWKKKSPEQTVADLEPVIRQYLHDWGKKNIVLAGYSFGANVVPFILNRLPQELQTQVEALVMLSPDAQGDFEIHVAGMLGASGGPYDVAAEVRSAALNWPVFCVRGEDEENDLQKITEGTPHVRWTKIPGSHHYNNNAAAVAATILSTRS